MKIKELFASLLLLLCVTSFAQTSVPTYSEVWRPVVLSGTKKSLTIKQSDVEKFMKTSDFGQRGKGSNKYWTVISDRDQNPVYESPTGSKVLGHLKWNQTVTILKIMSGRALVASGSFNDIDYPKLPINVKVLGWVPMTKLLLWETCPTDDAGIYYKALISLNLDAKNIRTDNTVGKLYGSPEILGKSQPLTTDKKFYYIMKREGNMVLLATQYTVSKGHSKEVLYGWVSEGSYVPWNQRSCLEPTWDEMDVTYFIDNSKSAPIYPNANTGNEVTRWEYKIQKKWKDYRMHGNELRFPILDGNVKDADGNIIKYNISSFGTSTGESKVGVAIGTGESIGVTEQALREMKKINICIVIDGTESMREYYPAVKDAIKNGCKLFVDKTVEVSIVIYRDKEHVLDGNSYETEIFRFTRPENTALHTFLDTGGEYGFRRSTDRTAEESVFYGMSKGLELFKGKERQSNIMLVVGDCGNNAAAKDNRLTEADVVRGLIERNVQLMVFQVAKKSTPKAYGTFTNQLSKILMENLQQKYTILQQQGVSYPATVSLKPIPGGRGYILENDQKSNIYVGSIRFPKPEQNMLVSELTSEMITSIDNLDKSIQNQIDVVFGTTQGGWRGGTGTTTGMTYDEAFVKKILGKDGVPDRNVVMSFKGYTPKIDPASKRELYKPVLFISSDEFKTLIMKLQPVAMEANRPSQDRSAYIDALKALIRSFVPDILPEDMDRMTQNQIMSIAAGLNEASSSVKGHSIAAIGDPHKVKHADYVSMLKKFAQKFRALKGIQATAYPYTMEFNGAKYYWIPIELLP